MAATDTPETNDEIDSIMNEIEELQKEMTSDTPEASAPATVVAEEATAESSGDSVDDILGEIQAAAGPTGSAGADSAGLEDTLSEIKAEATEGGLLDEAVVEATEVTEVVEVPKAVKEESMPKEKGDGYGASSAPRIDDSNDGTLSLTLSGNMTLKLKYEFEGQEVVISFADQALRVQMTDGTEFKVPVARATQASNVKSFKKAV